MLSFPLVGLHTCIVWSLSSVCFHTYTACLSLPLLLSPFACFYICIVWLLRCFVSLVLASLVFIYSCTVLRASIYFRLFSHRFACQHLFLPVFTSFCAPASVFTRFRAVLLTRFPFRSFLHCFACRLLFLALFYVFAVVFFCMSPALPGFNNVLFYRLHLHIWQ